MDITDRLARKHDGKPPYLHDIFFRFKRMYLAGRQHQINLLRHFGLTPARLEVLRMVLAGYTTQPALRRALGIARSTVSRMLIAMEARGFIVRTARAATRARKSIRLAPGLTRWIKRLLVELHLVYGVFLDRFRVTLPQHPKAFLDGLIGFQHRLERIARSFDGRSTYDSLLLCDYFDH